MVTFVMFKLKELLKESPTIYWMTRVLDYIEGITETI